MSTTLIRRCKGTKSKTGGKKYSANRHFLSANPSIVTSYFIWDNESEDDAGFQENASTKQAKALREYFMASSHPLAQHLVKNFKDTKRKKKDEVKTILDQMNIQKPNTDEYVEQLMTRAENILKLEQKLFEYTVKQSESDIAVPGLSPARETVESNRIATRRAGEVSPFTLEGLKAAFNLGDKASFDNSEIFKEYLEGINAQLAGNDATALQTFYDYLRYQPICVLSTFLPVDKNASGNDYSYTEEVETHDDTKLYFSGLTSSIPLLVNQLTLEKM